MPNRFGCISYALPRVLSVSCAGVAYCGLVVLQACGRVPGVGMLCDVVGHRGVRADARHAGSSVESSLCLW